MNLIPARMGALASIAGKVPVLVLPIFVLLFGSSFCMAKTIVLITPMVHVEPADNVQCNIINGGATDANVSVELIDWLGLVTLNSDFITVAAGRGFYLVHQQAADDYYFCRFTFAGKEKSLRGMLMVANASTGLLHASVPAN